MDPAPSAPADRDASAIAAYVERLGNVLTEAGMPRLASRVFAQLLADEDGRMTAAELTHALGVSPAAVSGAVRYLTQTHLVGKERERGSRRDVYVVEVDAWHGAMLDQQRLMHAIERALASGRDAVGGPSTLAGRRLQLSVEFIQFHTEAMVRMIADWQERKAQIVAAWPPDE